MSHDLLMCNNASLYEANGVNHLLYSIFFMSPQHNLLKYTLYVPYISPRRIGESCLSFKCMIKLAINLLEMYSNRFNFD